MGFEGPTCRLGMKGVRLKSLADDKGMYHIFIRCSSPFLLLSFLLCLRIGVETVPTNTLRILSWTLEQMALQFLALDLGSGQAADLIFAFNERKMMHPVVRWIKIFYEVVAMAPKVLAISTMAENPDFRNRKDIAGERKTVELQGLSGWGLYMGVTLQCLLDGSGDSANWAHVLIHRKHWALCGFISQLLIWLFWTGPVKQGEHSTTEVSVSPGIKQKFSSCLEIHGVWVLGRSGFVLQQANQRSWIGFAKKVVIWDILFSFPMELE